MVIFKIGDDLRNDLGIMVMGTVLQSLWDAWCPKDTRPTLQLYHVIPLGTDRGFIECVPNVKPLSEKQEMKITHPLLHSLAGAFLETWVFGARDRHFDNMMVTDENIFVMVDFGTLFGDHPVIDGPRWNIPPVIWSELMTNDEHFVKFKEILKMGKYFYFNRELTLLFKRLHGVKSTIEPIAKLVPYNMATQKPRNNG